MHKKIRPALLLTAVILTFLAATGAQASADYPCADGNTSCDPYSTVQVDFTPNTGGAGQLCRGWVNQPSTYCYIVAYANDGSGTFRQICARGITSSGWCNCKVESNGYVALTGSCSVH